LFLGPTTLNIPGRGNETRTRDTAPSRSGVERVRIDLVASVSEKKKTLKRRILPLSENLTLKRREEEGRATLRRESSRGTLRRRRERRGNGYSSIGRSQGRESGMRVQRNSNR